MHQVAVSTALFDGYPMAQALDEIGQCGIQWIEPAFIAGYVTFDEEDFSEANGRALGRELETRGLKINAVSGHIDLGGPDALARLGRRLEFAKAAGAHILITNAGKRSFREAIMRTIENAIPICDELDAVVAIENPGHGSGDLFGKAADGLGIVRHFDSHRLRLNYDFGNIFTYNDESIRPDIDFPEAAPFTVHAHLKDVASKNGAWEFVSLGDGSVDYRKIARALHCGSENLPVSLELPLRLTRPNKSDPRRARGPLPLTEIRNAIHRSLVYWEKLQTELGTGRPSTARNIHHPPS